MIKDQQYIEVYDILGNERFCIGSDQQLRDWGNTEEEIQQIKIKNIKGALHFYEPGIEIYKILTSLCLAKDDTPISIDSLKSVKFKDLSSDKNGHAYRRTLPGNLLEICFYIVDAKLRLQTVRNGFTTELKGIDTMEQLHTFWKGITGEDL